MNYCLGFMFDFDLQNVVLIRKKRPAWQEGLLMWRRFETLAEVREWIAEQLAK